MSVGGDIGEEGWAALASGLQQHPGFRRVFASRASMQQAPRAALKTIWDHLGTTPGSGWDVMGLHDHHVRSEIKVLKDGVIEGGVELKWAELEEILELTESQFLRKSE